jgi:GH18 family chitinase
MMYSEIIAAGFETFREAKSQAVLGYLKKDSGDGSTTAGTWVSFLDEAAVKAYVKFANEKGLGGAFSFDVSMDTIEWSSGDFNYNLTKAMAGAVGNE